MAAAGWSRPTSSFLLIPALALNACLAYTGHLPSCAAGQGESHGVHISGMGKDGPSMDVAATSMGVSSSFRKGEREVGG